jgi:hypothetical protein
MLGRVISHDLRAKVIELQLFDLLWLEYILVILETNSEVLQDGETLCAVRQQFKD